MATLESIISQIKEDPIASQILLPKAAVKRVDAAEVISLNPDVYKQYLKNDNEMQRQLRRIDYANSKFIDKVKSFALHALGAQQRRDLVSVFGEMSKELRRHAALVTKHGSLVTQLFETSDVYYESLIERTRESEESSIRAMAQIESYERHIKNIDQLMPHVGFSEERDMHLMKRKLNRMLGAARVDLATSRIRHSDSLYQREIFDGISELGVAVEIYVNTVKEKAENTAEHIMQTIKIYKAITDYIKQGMHTEAKLDRAQAAYNKVTELTAAMMELPIGRVQEATQLSDAQYKTREALLSSAERARYAQKMNTEKSRLR